MKKFYKITFFSKSGKLAPLETGTAAKSEKDAYIKITNYFFKNDNTEPSKSILKDFCIFPTDYTNGATETQKAYYNDKKPKIELLPILPI